MNIEPIANILIKKMYKKNQYFSESKADIPW